MAGRIVGQIDPVGSVVEEPFTRSHMCQIRDVKQRLVIEEQLLRVVAAGMRRVALAVQLTLLRLLCRNPVRPLLFKGCEQPGAAERGSRIANEDIASFGSDALKSVQAGGKMKGGPLRVGIYGLLDVASRSQSNAWSCGRTRYQECCDGYEGAHINDRADTQIRNL